MATCRACGRALVPDEEAVYRKLVNRGATSFLCIDCLSAYFHCPRRMIEEKIEQFRRMGCTLFAPVSALTPTTARPVSSSRAAVQAQRTGGKGD